MSVDQLKEELSVLRLVLGLVTAAEASVLGALSQPASLSAPWVVVAWGSVPLLTAAVALVTRRIRWCLRQLGGA